MPSDGSCYIPRMASLESSIVEVERQLGRELTPEEQHLMLYWYQMFGAREKDSTRTRIAARHMALLQNMR